jgi:hypothetical protein
MKNKIAAPIEIKASAKLNIKNEVFANMKK